MKANIFTAYVAIALLGCGSDSTPSGATGTVGATTTTTATGAGGQSGAGGAGSGGGVAGSGGQAGSGGAGEGGSGAGGSLVFDWSCVGHVEWPKSDGKPITATAVFLDFQTQAPIAGAAVLACAKDDPDCAAPHDQGVTDAAGKVTLTAPGGEIGFDGATYRAMQFDGPGVASLSMDDRMTVANMAIEAGGKNAIFPFDARTAEYVDARVRLNGTNSRYEPVEADRDQKFVCELVVNLDQLEPTVACHPDPGQRKKAKEMTEMKLDRAYVGSCTGGKTSDFVEFARVLRGRKVTIDTFGVPATPDIVHDLQSTRWGGETIWEILVGAGV